MKKRHILIPLFLIVTCWFIFSKAISANIDTDFGAIDPNYFGGAAPVSVDPEIIIDPESIQEAQDELKEEAAQAMTPQMMHDIEVMEVRLFSKKIPDGDGIYRLARLERNLTGRSWESLPLKDRMRRIRIASQRMALRGTSIPANLRGTFTPRRIDNDTIPLVETDDVGIIDGLLRLYSPEVYKAYRARQERMLRYE